MSEKCIIYKPLKHQKRLQKVSVGTKLSVDARMLKNLTSHLKSWINFDIRVKSLTMFHKR